MIPASTQGATKLLEALEKLSRWAGEPSGERPSGTPAHELVRAFETALEAPPPEEAAIRSSVEGPAMPGQGADLLPGPAERLPSLSPMGEVTAEGVSPPVKVHGATADPLSGTGAADAPAAQAPRGPQAIFRGEGISRQEALEELGRLLERVSGQGALVGPPELLRVQQLVGMLSVQAKAGVQTSQQTTQGLESLLRQSG